LNPKQALEETGFSRFFFGFWFFFCLMEEKKRKTWLELSYNGVSLTSWKGS